MIKGFTNLPNSSCVCVCVCVRVSVCASVCVQDGVDLGAATGREGDAERHTPGPGSLPAAGGQQGAVGLLPGPQEPEPAAAEPAAAEPAATEPAAAEPASLAAASVHLLTTTTAAASRNTSNTASEEGTGKGLLL